mmetsp:Transcript_8922/g.23013  ORF Transcript_8922/g.23013 Transcript_8922/m.23013 type:complete len:204 (-) Transcript_8922:3611-4222(-)
MLRLPDDNAVAVAHTVARGAGAPRLPLAELAVDRRRAVAGVAGALLHLALSVLARQASVLCLLDDIAGACLLAAVAGGGAGTPGIPVAPLAVLLLPSLAALGLRLARRRVAGVGLLQRACALLPVATAIPEYLPSSLHDAVAAVRASRPVRPATERAVLVRVAIHVLVAELDLLVLARGRRPARVGHDLDLPPAVPGAAAAGR